MVESGNLNTYLVSSSSEWVIDFGATYQSHPSTPTVTLEDGSQSCILGLGTIFPTSSIPLLSVLSLPNLSFNLIFMSKLTEHLVVVSHSFLIFVSFMIL